MGERWEERNMTPEEIARLHASKEQGHSEIVQEIERTPSEQADLQAQMRMQRHCEGLREVGSYTIGELDQCVESPIPSHERANAACW